MLVKFHNRKFHEKLPGDSRTLAYGQTDVKPFTLVYAPPLAIDNGSDQFCYTERLANLTHCRRVTQICVFTLQLCRTGDADLRFYVTTVQDG